MNWKPLNIIFEKLKIGYLFRIIYGAYCNKKYPEYNLFKALALKSGLPGSEVFKFETDGKVVTLFPFGQHLDQHGSNEITDLRSLKWDFVKPAGKIPWITKFRLYEKKTSLRVCKRRSCPDPLSSPGKMPGCRWWQK